jgi:hypothetical protein
VDGDAGDPLVLGKRAVAILETGMRTATHKLATLMDGMLLRGADDEGVCVLVVTDRFIHE